MICSFCEADLSALDLPDGRCPVCGGVVAAKNEFTHAGLSAQFAEHTIQRAYKALTWGVPQPRTGTVTGNIGRSPRNRKKMAVVGRGGKHAVTHYRVERVVGTATALIECRLETGRTHQIRVHMTSIGHPLVGDVQYGGGARRAKHLDGSVGTAVTTYGHQALHAFELGFIHPVSGNKMSWQSEVPATFTDLMALLEDA